MTPGPACTVALTRHPGTPGDAVRGARASVGRSAEGALSLTYVVEADLDRLRVPAFGAIRVGERLWQRTCFEVFVACEGGPEYHEYNFAPSGEWAAYAFSRYRENVPLSGAAAAELTPRIAVRRGAGTLELAASIRLDRLSPAHPAADLVLAVSAVVEDCDGALSYWALRHAPGKPDFHHPEAFALHLPAG